MATETAEIHKENPQGPENLSALRLTDRAIQQIKSILQREKLEGHGLRITVVGGGCSGFSYKLDFDKEKKPGDTILEMDGLKVYVDELSVKYLAGTVIDYVSGLYGAGFKFTNPNASGTCGCGTSFSA
jgi:iron-sulfur cluster assembly accessory protein